MAGNGGVIGPTNTVLPSVSVSENITTFNASGTFTAQSAPPSACGVRTADILVIAGGGGGAGGLVAAPARPIPGCGVTVTIGGGGATGGSPAAGNTGTALNVNILEAPTSLTMADETSLMLL